MRCRAHLNTPPHPFGHIAAPISTRHLLRLNTPPDPLLLIVPARNLASPLVPIVSQALKMTFDDMGFYSKLDVSYDKESCLLTVKGEEGEGREKSEATRAVTMPCKVIKPEMITAETRDGCVIVTVPGEAQAPIEEKKLENKKLDVRLVAAGEQPAAIGEQSGATAQKEKAGESYGRSVEQPSPPQ